MQLESSETGVSKIPKIKQFAEINIYLFSTVGVMGTFLFGQRKVRHRVGGNVFTRTARKSFVCWK